MSIYWKAEVKINLQSKQGMRNAARQGGGGCIL